MPQRQLEQGLHSFPTRRKELLNSIPSPFPIPGKTPIKKSNRPPRASKTLQITSETLSKKVKKIIYSGFEVAGDYRCYVINKPRDEGL